MTDLVHIASIYIALDGTYVAEGLDPALAARGNTPAIALLKLRLAMRDDEPTTNVIPFRKRGLR